MTYEVTMSVRLAVNGANELEALNNAMTMAKHQKLELIPTKIRLWCEPPSEIESKELADASKPPTPV